MSKFYRILNEVEAFKWTGGPDQTEDPEWMIDLIKKGIVKINYPELKFVCPYGKIYAYPGYWITKDFYRGIETYPENLFNERFIEIKE